MRGKVCEAKQPALVKLEAFADQTSRKQQKDVEVDKAARRGERQTKPPPKHKSDKAEDQQTKRGKKRPHESVENDEVDETIDGEPLDEEDEELAASDDGLAGGRAAGSASNPAVDSAVDPNTLAIVPFAKAPDQEGSDKLVDDSAILSGCIRVISRDRSEYVDVIE